MNSGINALSFLCLKNTNFLQIIRNILLWSSPPTSLLSSSNFFFPQFLQIQQINRNLRLFKTHLKINLCVTLPASTCPALCSATKGVGIFRFKKITQNFFFHLDFEHFRTTVITYVSGTAQNDKSMGILKKMKRNKGIICMFSYPRLLYHHVKCWADKHRTTESQIGLDWKQP